MTWLLPHHEPVGAAETKVPDPSQHHPAPPDIMCVPTQLCRESEGQRLRWGSAVIEVTITPTDMSGGSSCTLWSSCISVVTSIFRQTLTLTLPRHHRGAASHSSWNLHQLLPGTDGFEENQTDVKSKRAPLAVSKSPWTPVKRNEMLCYCCF